MSFPFVPKDGMAIQLAEHVLGEVAIVCNVGLYLRKFAVFDYSHHSTVHTLCG
jgi:hypothetical protein